MDDNTERIEVTEKPKAFWHRVYAAAIFVTFVVITILWAFSKYFSS